MNSNYDKLNDEKLIKYSRQILLPNFGLEGYNKLQKSTVMIVGAGGLGCSNAIYLAGSGVGSIIIVDNDYIELSNIPRQILYNQNDIGKSKAITSAKKLTDNYPDTNFSAINNSFNKMLVEEYHPDLIIDAGDNLGLTLHLGEISKITQTSLVHASVARNEGHIYCYLPQKNFPDINKVFPMKDNSQSCSQTGVLTTAVGIIATMQAHQAIKVLMQPKLGEIKPELILFEGKQMRFINIDLSI